jgi:ribosome-binding ATPase YchF (GTP1/OBG family)
MKIALAGAPRCGRSTLFRALGGSPRVDTGKPLTVKVPDPRLDFLAEHWKPRSLVHATVSFTDIPSPAFGSRSMAMLRESAAVALVLDNHAAGNLRDDLASAEGEMMLADYAILEKRRDRLRKESRAGSREFELVNRALEFLERETPLRTAGFNRQETDILSPYSPASLKPLMVISNRAGGGVSDESEVRQMSEAAGAAFLTIDAGLELELCELPEEERPEFLVGMGYSDPGLSRIIRAAYSLLDLVSFLTMGPDEVRAWPIPRGSTALDAAGTIHSDLARGFIRAQVIPFGLFRETPDEAALRKKGAVGLEGKEYPVRDGDILEIRFSV